MSRGIAALAVFLSGLLLVACGLRIGSETAEHELERACLLNGQVRLGRIDYQCAPARVVSRRSGEKTA